MESKRPSVLLIGENAQGSSYLASRLDKRECECSFASSCREAFLILQDQKVDLVLSPMSLPDGTLDSKRSGGKDEGCVNVVLSRRSADARPTQLVTFEGAKMKINSEDFRVRHGQKVKLRKWPTIVKPFCKSKKQYQKLLKNHVEELSSLQQLHYASDRYALLLIFQGIDSAEKDGAIRHVMSGVNPEGCEVFSFKQPSAEELKHDFLWRTTSPPSRTWADRHI